MLYVVSILCLVSAGLLFGSCGVQWMQGVPLDERDPWIAATERLRRRQSVDNSDKAAASPLLEQAEALALYLNPPKPPHQETSRSTVRPPSVSPAPAPRPPSPTPQFRILAISYYRSNPQKSLAMVWDATKGGYWIKQGDRLGHFVVERIEKEAVIYRDGDHCTNGGRSQTVGPVGETQVQRVGVSARDGGPPETGQRLALKQVRKRNAGGWNHGSRTRIPR
jgi:hypothetical protein